MRWLLLIPLFLASCTTPQQGLAAIREVYYGRNADYFFIKNGPPKSGYQMNSGGMIYLWEPRGSGQMIPGVASASSSYEPNYFGGGGTLKTSLSQSSSYIPRARCQLQITTDARGRINDIHANWDSIGPRTLSFIYDYFADERKAVAPPGQVKKDAKPKERVPRSFNGTLYL